MRLPSRTKCPRRRRWNAAVLVVAAAVVMGCSQVVTAVPLRSIRVVGLGDSVMSGSACDCPGPVTALAQRIATRGDGRRVEAMNLGEEGAVTADVSRLLETDKGRAAVRDADIVVVIVGANDLTGVYADRESDPTDPAPLEERLADLRGSLGPLLDELQHIHGPSPVTYLIMGYWNVFSEVSDADTPGYSEWSRHATAAANRVIAEVAGGAGMRYVDLAYAFRGPRGDGDPTPFLADDGDHPNARGDEVIADALFDALG